MIEKYSLHCGHIILKRKEKDFQAAFCITRAALSALTADLSMLHQVEKEHYHRLQFDRRRHSYLLGRIAAKKAVSKLAGISEESFYIDAGVFEFPVVKNTWQNIQATISHCDDIGMALAFAEEHPLGLDIEHINGERADVMKSQVSAAETALLQSCNIPLVTGYTIAWTIKEALSKIIRTGLTMDMHVAEITSLEKNGSYYTATFRHFAQYKAIAFCSANYACCIVMPGKTTADLDKLYKFFTDIAT